MEKESIILSRMDFMMENSKMDCMKDMGSQKILIKLFTKVILNREQKMVKGFKSTLTNKNMKESLKMIKKMGLEHTIFKITINILANGKITNIMDKGDSNSLMEISMKDLIKKMKKMVREF